MKKKKTASTTTEVWELEADHEEAAPPPEDLERTERLIKEFCLPAWEAWSSDLLTKAPELVNLPCEIFSEYSGATEASPLAFMFMGFCGGYATGILSAKEEKGTE